MIASLRLGVTHKLTAERNERRRFLKAFALRRRLEVLLQIRDDQAEEGSVRFRRQHCPSTLEADDPMQHRRGSIPFSKVSEIRLNTVLGDEPGHRRSGKVPSLLEPEMKKAP